MPENFKATITKETFFHSERPNLQIHTSKKYLIILNASLAIHRQKTSIAIAMTKETNEARNPWKSHNYTQLLNEDQERFIGGWSTKLLIGDKSTRYIAFLVKSPSGKRSGTSPSWGKKGFIVAPFKLATLFYVG